MARRSPKTREVASGITGRLLPPPGGVVIRMYRIGHGDCFLLGFDGDRPGQPAYLLIDCGYKPGSPQFLNTTIRQVTESIRHATGGHIDVVVVTHEHQDHVNGFTKENFDGMSVGHAWFAWTEDPQDDLATHLRRTFQERLFGVIAARNRLAAVGDLHELHRIDDLLAFELGGTDTELNLASAHELLAGRSPNKESMKLVRGLAANDPVFIRPHEGVLRMPGASNVRVFALGPPRNVELLRLLNPEGSEIFHLTKGAASYFAAAARRGNSEIDPEAPFEKKYSIAWDQGQLDASPFHKFFSEYYGSMASKLAWRRIDDDWLQSGGQLALDMNRQTNNSSLVLALELGGGGKVVLFAGDAQRGNWASWANAEWRDGSTITTARDLLSRTVLYKVGHHGSHNATLNGQESDPYPNLHWMGLGDHAREFTAMITAVRAWAETQKGWDHPFWAIKRALLKKASGRVFQTDTDFARMARTPEGSELDWQAFRGRTTATPLYFDYRVTP